MNTRQLVAISALALMSAPSWADNLLALTRPGNASFSPCSTANLPLNAAGGTFFNFSNPVAGPVTVTFSAECAVAGPLPDQARWVSVVIFVDGVARAPTSGTNALCSGNGTAALDGWVDASVTAVINPLTAGIHNLRIQKVAGNGATSCWISDTSTVVTR